MKHLLLLSVICLFACCASRTDNKWDYEYSNKLMDTVAMLDQQIPSTTNKDVLFALRGAKLKTVVAIAEKMDDEEMQARVISRYNQMSIPDSMIAGAAKQ